MTTPSQGSTMIGPVIRRARRTLGRAHWAVRRHLKAQRGRVDGWLDKRVPPPSPRADVQRRINRIRIGYKPAQMIAELDRDMVSLGMRDDAQRVYLARAAAKVGDLKLASAIAEDALSMGVESDRAQLIVDQARDRLDVLQHGWPRRPRGVTPYEPRPRAVLSVLSQSLPWSAGGYATRSHGLITAVRDRGWDVEVVTRLGFPYDRWDPTDEREVPAFDVVDGVTYHRALIPGQRSYPQTPIVDYVAQGAEQVIEAASRHRAKLIHASSFYATGQAGAEAAAALNLPFVYEMRGLEDLMRTSAFAPYGRSVECEYLVEAEVEVCRRADHVFVITEALLDEMVRRGVPRERMSVLPNGVHANEFQPIPRDEALAAELGFSGKTVIGYLGGFPHYEGLRLLMKAVASLRERRDDFGVLMVGDGPLEKTLRQDAKKLDLKDTVVFTGRVPHDDVPRYLSLTDITPFPRLPLPVCELISPMKPFEAMATGKAVVVSDVAALTQIVTDGVTGLTFTKGSSEALADALERLLDDAELRARLGESAIEWVRTNADWSGIASEVDRVYDQLIGGRHDG